MAQRGAATRPARWSIREDWKRALVARAGVRAVCARAVVCSRHPFRHVPAARSRSDRELVLAHFAGRERVHQLGQSSRRCRRYACAERAAHVCTDESPRRHPLFADGMSSEKPPGRPPTRTRAAAACPRVYYCFGNRPDGTVRKRRFLGGCDRLNI